MNVVFISCDLLTGGLTASEMSTLSETQIDSIAAADMSYIPPTAFAVS
jgi:hypothetical protein